jgi:uncharacterized protein involved in exopolysaccharide biosynthesis/Mrp family chromosome partitioning ATPase
MSVMESTTNQFPMFPDWSDEVGSSDELKIDLRRLLLGVWSRRVLVLGISAVFFILFLMTALMFVERTWTAKVTLLKKEQQDEFQVGRYGIPFKSQNYAFKTLLDTLMLPGTLQQAMEDSGVNLPTHRMASLVGLHVSRDSKAFTITVNWNDQVKVAEIANNLSAVFIERNRSLRRKEVEDALSKYTERQSAANEAVNITARDLANFEIRHNISDLDTQIAVLLEKRQDLEVEIREIEADRAAAGDEIERLNTAIDSSPEMIIQSSYYLNPLKKNLATLEWELVQARSRYTDENPKVLDLLKKIDDINRLIQAGKDSETPSNTYTSNPVREELQVKRHESRAEQHKASTRYQHLSSMIEEMDKRISFLSGQKKSHEELEENRLASLQLERDLRQRVDSLKVLVQSHSGDFELIEHASVPDQPDASGRKLLVLAGTILGGFIGLLVALGLELFDRRLWTSRDLSILKNFDLILEVPRANSSEAVRVSPHEPVAPVARTFRRIVNDLEALLSDTDSKNLAIVSLDSGEGRSTVATNLAQALRQKEADLCLVDADLRPVSKDQRCSLETEQEFEIGCFEFLSDDRNIELLKQHVDQDSGRNSGSSVFVPAYAKHESNDSDALKLGGQAMRRLRDCIEQENRWVLYDLPPLSLEEAALEAAIGIGTVILVVRSGATHRERLRLLMERMERHGIRVAAAVLVDVPEALLSLEQKQMLIQNG